ncbi:Uma2 family endonuclease [Sphaerospermopsis aphanizomenoides BCCUSP55]|uniref:Uma2 family endonuclease n=1 Tax=Sphaerospermopsis aphanizomenoides TaxID=459663 RepID=UPI000AB4E120|nr:Uma2 family endonuclease [Sphaerospermopsis aphanizomenoides]MBK1988469.1 Uma2 family endonuclease [Sphaerospermopsis aphanizomenoides BCCUSP55]
MVISPTHPPNPTTEVTNTHFTPDEYRAMEETAQERHEYCNGEIIVMPGGSEVHSRISVNITTLLNVALRDTDFQTYNGDLRIWIPEFNHGTYADVMVINGEPEFNNNRTDEILNPLLIIEVLSPSTEGYDRGDKFRKYRSLSSFCEYLLVSQTEPYIEHYSQQENYNIWQLQAYDQIDKSVFLHSLNVEVPLNEIYRRIKF